MDGAQRDDVMQRAATAHRRAESALSRMFGNFGRYEDDGRASRLLENALAREQETWIAAFGSLKLRELAVQTNARDEAGRLVHPWLQAERAVEKRLMIEWQRAPAWTGARTPGQEWTPVPQTYDRRPHALRAYVQKQALARATAAADVAWQKRDKVRCSSHFGKPTWQTRLKKRIDGDLHEKLRAALAREWSAWVAVHGSRELKRLPSFHERNGGWRVHEAADALRGMRQLGAEWLAKEYPGWQLMRGYRSDGHRPTLVADEYNITATSPEQRQALEGALGMAMAAPMSEARRADPKAELVVFSESEHSVRERALLLGREHPVSADHAAGRRGPYVFGARVERRLPGSWVTEPVVLVFSAQQQRELNALVEREQGVLPSRSIGPEERERDKRGAIRDALVAAKSGETLKSRSPRQQTEAGRRSVSLSTMEATMSESQEKAERFEAMREALARQYGKPVLPVPQGAEVKGRVVALLTGDESARMRAVVEGDKALHFIGVAFDKGRQMLGFDVAVRNERGALSLSSLERPLPGPGSGQGARPLDDRGLAHVLDRVDSIRVTGR
jgi:hypothetical protein